MGLRIWLLVASVALGGAAPAVAAESADSARVDALLDRLPNAEEGGSA